MSPFNLEAKHLVPIKDDAFPGSVETQILQGMIKQPNAVIYALKETPLRFSLVPQKRRAVRLGTHQIQISA